ncbi:MAG TPA: polysaccharide lyase family protein [Opitutaceae bacterium]|nr:polysaccharide lyase family protein [Opitutaceae bacterium]
MKSTVSPTLWSLLVLAAASFSLAAPVLRAADAAPVVAQPASSAAVTVSEDDQVFTLANGIVTARINKRTGELVTLLYQGIDTMGHDQGHSGVWEEDPSQAEKVGGLTRTLTIDPAKNGGARAEISIKGVTGGKIGLTPGSPGGAQGGTQNLDLEIRYALGRGESGVYTYAIFSHPAEYGPLNVPESRFITFLNQTFDWISVDADRNMLEAAPTDWGTGVVVHAKEQRIMSKGVYKNSVEHKYSYNAVQYKIPAYGWSSTKDHIGIWFINPTIEYLSGGATKQELVCHFGDNGNPDPIILDYWRGTHYGGGATASVPAGESWNKVVGPIFIYVNSLSSFRTPSAEALATLAATAGNPTIPAAWQENGTALWQEALAQAKKEKAKWPYDWVNGVDYPHRDGRADVKGQLVLIDPQASSTKLPHLTVGLAYPDYTVEGRGGFGPPPAAAANPAGAPANAAGGPPRGGPGPGRGAPGRGGFGGPRTIDWVHDAKHYQFWNDGTEDGKFTITNVRPGKYTLHAFADGVLGEFARTDITVEAGKPLDLGKLEWHPVRYGRQVWDIGFPDRTGGKFFKGDGANYWLWGWGLRYTLLFPQDIVYTIGKSDYRKDWFFQQTPRATSMAWLNPEAKDPANQRFGWVKAESLEEYPQTNQSGPWRIYGRGTATTWTIKFEMPKAEHGQAVLRVSLAGADANGGLIVGVNGQEVGTLHPTSTNALRYNTDKGIWQEQDQRFDASLLKAGTNEIQLTVPAGEVTSGVVYDYLRLELDETPKPVALN